MLGLLGLFAASSSGVVTTTAPGVATGPRIVEIPPHLGLLDIARRLDEADVIRSPFGFALLALVQGRARSLKAGEYEVPQGSNTFAVLSLLEGGKVLKHTVLLREGSTLAELARAVEAEGLGPAADMIRVGHDPLFLRSARDPGASVEGYLFPDYLPVRQGRAAGGDARAHGDEDARPAHAGAREGGRGARLHVHQLLTLASIIEREAVVPSELPLISAVFWNRLKLEMPLQADPTVQYAIGKGRQALTRDDLPVDHPFNTYRRPGLPPGPIANPGFAPSTPRPIRHASTTSTSSRWTTVATSSRRA